MEKTTSNGIRYEHLIGAGVITQIDDAEIPNAKESDEFVNITFTIENKESEGSSNTFAERAQKLGISQDLIKPLEDGINVRTCTALVNLSNFPNIDFEKCMEEKTRLPFTAIFVSVKSMLDVMGADGSRVRKNEEGYNFASIHKRGYLGFVDECSEAVLSIFDKLRENLESGEYITDEDTDEDTNKQTDAQNHRNNRRR